MDKSAVDTIAQLGVEAAGANHLADLSAVIIHGTQKIESLEHLQPRRNRYRGAFNTRNLVAFLDHIEHTRDAVLDKTPAGQLQGFVDTDTMTARVFFNLGTATEPGHGDHHATLNLKPTAAYAAVLAATSRPHDQRTLHDFLEDFREHIEPVYGETADGTRMANALAAIRDITVEKARTVQNEVRDMGNSASAMERVDASSRLTLPNGFQFTCVPYEGLGLRKLSLRLGVNTGGDRLALVLRLQQAEKVTEAIANEVVALLGDKLGTTVALAVGTFKP
ncbi:DUF2303 family protein [Dyella ginsengisoli]|uniref:DUF2303 family protein n=1 Tax=Dyella ginsengisoli TaxID=363848 RepID=A0ABW8JTS0_9GAMM